MENQLLVKVTILEEYGTAWTVLLTNNVTFHIGKVHNRFKSCFWARVVEPNLPRTSFSCLPVERQKKLREFNFCLGSEKGH